ncbi:hypothetical protein SAY87_016064 [Trapa incisa]|uniref:Protein WVD2-like 7 n=1 Tax=Trapa incisa TaxID=236973 RepID=A0AAN7QYN8_9MYRT|nr:hypothetical protein SAY87_016064 [Trapa incisa]
MSETAAPNAALEVSISFGRFQNDSLSWEKWSSFSPNKYLEEVEKCATPGSVAEKKAYFEAHYEKIAARKAELMEQEKQMEMGLSRSYVSVGQRDLARSDAEADHVMGAYAPGMEQMKYKGRLEQEMEPNEDDLITIECDSFAAEPERVQGPEKSVGRPNLDKLHQESSVKEVGKQEVIPTITVTTINESHCQLQEDLSKCQENSDEKLGNTTIFKQETTELNPQKRAQKIFKGRKERSTIEIKKKPTSPLPKLPHVATPKVSKPIFVSSAPSASRSSTRARPAQTSVSKNLNPPPSTDNLKKVAGKSLHLTTTTSPMSSQASVPTPSRKSLIMESMGEKDIVKKAFKMFRNNVREVELTSNDKSPMPKQVSSSGSELRASHSNVTHKENGGVRSGAAEQRGRRASAPSLVGMTKEKSRVAPQRGKKFWEKPNATEQEKMNRQLKLEEEDKVAENKTLRQARNMKAPSRPASESRSKVNNAPGKGL